MTMEVETTPNVNPGAQEIQAADSPDVEPKDAEAVVKEAGEDNATSSDKMEDIPNANDENQHVSTPNIDMDMNVETNANTTSPTSAEDMAAKEEAAAAKEEAKIVETVQATPNPNAMALNVAYEALEHVRKANVSIEFGRDLGPKECIPCLRERLVQQATPNKTRYQTMMANRPSFGRNGIGRAAPCLTCGSPVCPRHRNAELKRENINICLDCSAFFSLDTLFVEMNNENRLQGGSDTIQAREFRKRQMNSMLDVYDRALLVLKYSSKYIQEIATALEENTKRNDKIGLGSSATGFASGIVGVAAAVTIFTPAGPPLLIASILFGGGATAASAGSEAVNYHSSANKMADTIYALHGMVHSISRLTEKPSNSNTEEAETQEGNSNVNEGDQEGEGGAANTAASPSQSQPRSPPQRKNNYSENRGQARNWTRAAANAIKPLTAGALSAASIVVEAREMRQTLDKINAGSPCAKAEYLRSIADEIETFPTTTTLAEACPELFNLQ